jgi:hypothetical protein
MAASILDPAFAGTQEGTLHFRYLLPENGGFLHVSNSIAEHVGQLAAALRDPGGTRERTQRFVARFLRPHGLTAACTPILGGALEQAAASGRRPVRAETAGTRWLRVLLLPVAALFRWLHLNEDIPALIRRAAYQRWARLGRGTRLVLKRLVVNPARLVISAVSWLGRRVRRLLRQGRYRLGTRVRGRALTGEGTDGRR